MIRFRHIAAMTVCFLLVGQTCFGAQAYVTDTFRISLRRGPSIENKILKFLPSGLPVEVLESEEGWSHVAPLGPEEDNIRGWVLSRYLITRPPWETQAKALKEENISLVEKLAQIEKEHEATLIGRNEASENLEVNREALQKLQKEYETLKQGAAEFLKLEAAYKALEKTSEEIMDENERLKSSEARKWFTIGALVLLFGLLLGLLFGRQKRRRSSLYQ